MATTVKTEFDIKLDLATVNKSTRLSGSKRYTLVNDTIDFNSSKITDSSTLTIYESTTSAGSDGIVCLYFESISTNRSTIDLSLTNLSTGLSAFFTRVKPGEKVVMPVWANDANGIQIKATAGSTGGVPSTVNYFVGVTASPVSTVIVVPATTSTTTTAAPTTTTTTTAEPTTTTTTAEPTTTTTTAEPTTTTTTAEPTTTTTTTP